MPRLVVLVAAAAFVVSILTAAPASADWNNTRWGMTREQVAAIYPRALPDPAAPAARPVLEHPAGLVWMGRTWDKVRFNFDPQRGLATVAMFTGGPRQDLIAALTARYGPPYDRVDMGLLQVVYFRDPANGDEIWIMGGDSADGRWVSWAPAKA